MRRVHIATGAVIAALAATLAGCGGSSSPSTAQSPPAQSPGTQTQASTPAAAATAPADVAGAKAQIKANWTAFFAYNTPRAKAASLLEGGSAMSGALAYATQEQKATHIKQAVAVKIITFTDATHAQVVYALLNGTKVLLPTASGVALLDGGTWKVSKATFCTLVQLGANGKTVPDC